MPKPMQSKFLPLDPNEYVLRSDAERFARESVEEALAEERSQFNADLIRDSNDHLEVIRLSGRVRNLEVRMNKPPQRAMRELNTGPLYNHAIEGYQCYPDFIVSTGGNRIDGCAVQAIRDRRIKHEPAI